MRGASVAAAAAAGLYLDRLPVMRRPVLKTHLHDNSKTTLHSVLFPTVVRKSSSLFPGADNCQLGLITLELGNIIVTCVSALDDFVFKSSYKYLSAMLSSRLEFCSASPVSYIIGTHANITRHFDSFVLSCHNFRRNLSVPT